jgi:hypothetical protein
MFRFYIRLLTGAVSTTWDTADRWWAVLTVITTALIAAKHDWLASKLGSVWWIAAPAALLFLYRLLRENYLVISELRDVAENIPTPDVMFQWGFTHLNKSGFGLYEFDKDILVHNRSHEWIYNVIVSPIKLGETLTFDKITEIESHDYKARTPQWDRFPGQTKKMVTDFLCREMNIEKAKEIGIYHSKDVGVSEFTMTIPIDATFMHGAKTWKLSAIFTFDPAHGDFCSFEKVSIKPNASARYRRYWETQSA